MDEFDGRVIDSLGEVRLKGLKRNLIFCSQHVSPTQRTTSRREAKRTQIDQAANAQLS
jgi:hypothetical protein